MAYYSYPYYGTTPNQQQPPSTQIGGPALPLYPPTQPTQPTQPTPTPPVIPTKSPFIEQSYIENILRLNRGKVASIYMNFENSQWGSKIFRGIIEAAGRDHIILSDLATETRYLLPTIYLNYITFDEEIAYYYPFDAITNIPGLMPNQQPQTTQQAPTAQQKPAQPRKKSK